jgi:hypothetical protein
MKNASDIDRVALKEILKFRRDGGGREDALALAKLIFQKKADQAAACEVELKRIRTE